MPRGSEEKGEGTRKNRELDATRHGDRLCIFLPRILRVAERAAESATAIARSRPLADKGRQKAEMRNANGIPFSALSSFTGSDKKNRDEGWRRRVAG